MPLNRKELIAELQSNICRLQGFKPGNNLAIDDGLGPIRDAFPGGTFPLGAVHEFLFSQSEDAAATNGFITGLLSSLMGSNGISLWISTSRKLFPPALRSFGVSPDHFIFIDLQKEKDILWAMDEALKCGALTAVIGELKDITFTASRRLQLAVENSQVTGFVLRNSTRSPGTTACISRWKVSSIRSEVLEDLPGIGFPAWRVEILRMRNGKTGVWNIQWREGRFISVNLDRLPETESLFIPATKAG